MKFIFILLFISALAFLIISCTSGPQDNSNINKTEINMDDKAILISKKQALKIAKEDAQLLYRDLSIYDVKIELKEGNWIVDYDIADPQMLGGGPHYVISSKTGEIISYRYEQ